MAGSVAIGLTRRHMVDRCPTSLWKSLRHMLRLLPGPGHDLEVRRRGPAMQTWSGLDHLEPRLMLSATNASAEAIGVPQAPHVAVTVEVLETGIEPQYEVHHTPRLQLGNAALVGFVGSEQDQVEVLWQTISAGTGTEDSFAAAYRLPGEPTWQSVEPINMLDTNVGTRIVHSVVIAGLAFDTTYEYRIDHLRNDTVIASYQSPFHTRLAAGDDTAFSFVAYGDSAHPDTIDDFRAVQDRINQTDAAFAVLLGDNVQGKGKPIELDGRFNPEINPEATEWNAGHIDFLSVGNHEIMTLNGKPTRDNFAVPVPEAEVSAPVEPPSTEPREHNYSFDYGNVHFVTFDTNSLDKPKRLEKLLSWVEADLAASQARWNIVFGHHPPIFVNENIRTPPCGNYFQQAVPRLHEAGADLFMTGHSHRYMRTFPLLGSRSSAVDFVADTDDDYAKGTGLVQLISGVGGFDPRGGSYSSAAYVAAGFTTDTDPPSEIGFAQIDVTPARLAISYIAADDGAVLDQFTITDNGPQLPSEEPENGTPLLDPVDFDEFDIEIYDPIEDLTCTSFLIEDDGASLHLSGNTWKAIAASYSVTPNTVLEFDFASSAEGSLHAIGLDPDLRHNPTCGGQALFELYGSERAIGDDEFRDYNDWAPAFKHYVIPVGDFFTGPVNYLTFINEHKAKPRTAESVFSNVRLYEGEPRPTPAPDLLATIELIQGESFADCVADAFVPQSGTWDVSAAHRYTAVPEADSDAISLLQLTGTLPPTYEMQVSIHARNDLTKSRGSMIFDYRDPENFKYAGVSPGTGRWEIGRVEDGESVTDAFLEAPVIPNATHHLKLIFHGSVVTLEAKGVDQLAHDYGAPLSGGGVGLIANHNEIHFDDFVLKYPDTNLPYADDFDDRLADFFLPPVSGQWTFSNTGGYRVTAEQGGNGIALVNSSELHPYAVRVLVSSRSRPVSGGRYSNAFVVFDYRSETEFKFAGGFFGAHKWRIGHVENGQWIFDAEVKDGIGPARDYETQVVLHGSSVDLLAEGALKLSHEFADPVTNGVIGLGSLNAIAHFDNFRIEAITASVPYGEDFSDGRADLIEPLEGAWRIHEGRFEASGGHAVTRLITGTELPDRVRLAATLGTVPGGGPADLALLIFDYRGPANFKYAGARFGDGQWQIGRFLEHVWKTEAAVPGSLDALNDYEVEVSIEGSNATLSINGVVTVSHDFSESLTGGGIGLGANAPIRFDDFLVEELTTEPSLPAATVPHDHDFNDGSAHFMHVTSGFWHTAAGTYIAQPKVGDDAISLLPLADPPANLRFSARVNGDAPLNGYGSNAVLIFDYNGPRDFKYAGVFFEDTKWEIGHVTAKGWFTESAVINPIGPAVNHDLDLYIDGSMVTLVVNGTAVVTHHFQQALDTGRIGLGTRSAVARFDNLDIDAGTFPPPVTTLPYYEGFKDGVADFLHVRSGTWQLSESKFKGQAPDGGAAVSLISLSDPLSTSTLIETVVIGEAGTGDGGANAVIIFDYQDPDDYKFAGAFFGQNRWKIGHVTGGMWITDATVVAPLGLNFRYDVQLVLLDTRAQMFLSGRMLTSFDFAEPVTDGRVGLGNHNATALFDNIRVGDMPLLPASEDFDDGEAQEIHVVTGNWQIASGRYEVTPAPGRDGLATLGIEPLPPALQVRATINGDSATPGRVSNAVLIFDFMNAGNFRFAGAFWGDGKWKIGHVRNTIWYTDAFVKDTIVAETDYAVELLINGTGAKLSVDGDFKVAHDFGETPKGRIGLATHNAIASFDDLDVREVSIVPYMEDFQDGFGDFLETVVGAWQAVGGRYESTAPAGEDAVTVLKLLGPLTARTRISATINGATGAGYRQNAVLIFDYHSPLNFRYAGVFFGTRQLRIGRYDRVAWETDAAVTDLSLTTGTDLQMEIYLDGTRAVLAVDGTTRLSHDFRADLSDGLVGLATNNALSAFDDLDVRAITAAPPAPPATSLPLYEDFEDGTADFIHVVTGTWKINEAKRIEVKANPDQNAAALLSLTDPLPAAFLFKATVVAEDAVLIYDYRGPTDFKYAGVVPCIEDREGCVQIGHVEKGLRVPDAKLGIPTLALAYEITLFIQGDAVTLLMGGAVLSHDFVFTAGGLSGGSIGLSTHGTTAQFDDLAVQAAPMLPYEEDFEDADSGRLEPMTGIWQIDGGRFEAAPLPVIPSIALLRLAHPGPGGIELSATLSLPAGQAAANGLLIFDYHSFRDFKFAGAFGDENEWRIGHVRDSDWVTDAVMNETIDPNRNYVAQVILDAGTATLLVDGAVKAAFDFSEPFNDGLTGLATREAHAAFDTFAVRRLALPPHQEDFGDDTADFFLPQSGNWSINARLRYRGEATADQDAISLLKLGGPLPEAFEFDVTIRGKVTRGYQNAVAIFDFHGSSQFKFAGAFFGANRWRIGTVENGIWTFDTAMEKRANLTTEKDYRVELLVQDNTVTLSVDGQVQVSHVFAESLNDGQIGLGTLNAVAIFDDVSLLKATAVNGAAIDPAGHESRRVTSDTTALAATAALLFPEPAGVPPYSLTGNTWEPPNASSSFDFAFPLLRPGRRPEESEFSLRSNPDFPGFP